MAKKNPFIKPYLKWAGGKRQLLPEIMKYVPKRFNTYYEPFIGAGAVFLHLQPKRAVINDFNSQLVMTYETIRDNVDELIVLLSEHKERNNEDYFYEIRELDRTKDFESMTNVQKAARLIYLNKTCFNGLYRVNSAGLFNVPFGRYKNPAILEEPVLRALSQYLSDPKNEIQILNGDFQRSLAGVQRGDLVYADPPYHSPDNTNFTGYQAGGFSEDDQIRLRDEMIRLRAIGAKCIFSNSDTPFIREIYTGFNIKQVDAKRNINSNGEARGNVKEVIITSW